MFYVGFHMTRIFILVVAKPSLQAVTVLQFLCIMGRQALKPCNLVLLGTDTIAGMLTACFRKKEKLSINPPPSSR